MAEVIEEKKGNTHKKFCLLEGLFSKTSVNRERCNCYAICGKVYYNIVLCISPVPHDIGHTFNYGKRLSEYMSNTAHLTHHCPRRFKEK